MGKEPRFQSQIDVAQVLDGRGGRIVKILIDRPIAKHLEHRFRMACKQRL